MTAALFNVEKSLLNRFWLPPDPVLARSAETLLQRTGLSEPLCRVLAMRDVPPEEVESFLKPELRTLMPDPSSLKDMDAACDSVLRAVQTGKRIAIFADYDVDGGASAALLLGWLRGMGRDATLYVPDRIEEGYGPNIPAMEALGRAHDLIVCVDCGTLSHEPIAAARQAGAEVVVLDHHQGGETNPECAAVVNPNRQDEDSELGYLCAAGVVFMLLVALNRALRAQSVQGPDLLSMLDLVALATVADVAPLVGLNRAFVRQGLKVMAGRKRAGLVALSDVSGLKSAPTAANLGFAMGPRVNAGGRVGEADLGARLLACDDVREAMALAQRLDQLNTERREIEAAVLEAASRQVEARGAGKALVWAADAGWHPGVVGIVAARLKEHYRKPAVVIGFEDGQGKGSARSVTGVNLGACVAQLVREETILGGGGHAMAAGLSLSQDQLEPAMERLDHLLYRQMGDSPATPQLRIDAVVNVAGATPMLIDQLEQAGPFGAAAKAPRFVIPSARIGFAKPVGQSHLKLFLRGDGPGALDAIAFGAAENALGPALSQHDGKRFHIAGRLEINEWGGRRSAQLRIEDAAPAN